jgi:hypothetical protein
MSNPSWWFAPFPDIPHIPYVAPVIPEPLVWTGHRTVDPDGTVVTINPRTVQETDLIDDEDGQPQEVTLPDRTVWDIRVNGYHRSVCTSPDEAYRVVERYRLYEGGLAAQAY